MPSNNPSENVTESWLEALTVVQPETEEHSPEEDLNEVEEALDASAQEDGLDADERARIRRSIETANAAHRASEQRIIESMVSRHSEETRVAEAEEGATRSTDTVPARQEHIQAARNQDLEDLLETIEDGECSIALNECPICLAIRWVLREHAALSDYIAIEQGERLLGLGILTPSRGGTTPEEWRMRYGEPEDQHYVTEPRGGHTEELAEPNTVGTAVDDGESAPLDDPVESTRREPDCDCSMCAPTDASRSPTPNPLLVGPQPDDRRTAKAKRLP